MLFNIFNLYLSLQVTAAWNSNSSDSTFSLEDMISQSMEMNALIQNLVNVSVFTFQQKNLEDLTNLPDLSALANSSLVQTIMNLTGGLQAEQVDVAG